MPLNEAAGFRKVGLNREQRHAQEAAIYGVQVSQEQITLSHDEAERLRALLTQHDKQSMPKQFDLNAPPKEPYRYQEFPCVIYDHEARATRIVHSAEERALWLAEGWDRKPFPAEAAEVSLDPDEAAEVANVDRVLNTKRGPGRPRKIETVSA
jgi:hypothetical protein